jgi:SAM-dependent methyltransferase
VPTLLGGDRQSAAEQQQQEKPARGSARQRRLAANKRKSKSTKAQNQLNRDFEEERRRISEAGVAGLFQSQSPPPLVVDFGCGEGWWLKQVVEAVATAAADDDTASTDEVAARFAAFDASPDAARMAAKLLNPSSPRPTSTSSPSAAPAAPPLVEVAVADAQSNALPFLSGRIWHFHHVMLQSKHQLMTANMVHVTNLTPGNDKPTLRLRRRCAQRLRTP